MKPTWKRVIFSRSLISVMKVIIEWIRSDPITKIKYSELPDEEEVEAQEGGDEEPLNQPPTEDNSIRQYQGHTGESCDLDLKNIFY